MYNENDVNFTNTEVKPTKIFKDYPPRVSEDFKKKFKKFLMVMMFMGLLVVTFAIANAMVSNEFSSNTRAIDKWTKKWYEKQEKIDSLREDQQAYSNSVKQECKYIMENSENPEKVLTKNHFDKCKGFQKAEM